MGKGKVNKKNTNSAKLKEIRAKIEEIVEKSGLPEKRRQKIMRKMEDKEFLKNSLKIFLAFLSNAHRSRGGGLHLPMKVLRKYYTAKHDLDKSEETVEELERIQILLKNSGDSYGLTQLGLHISMLFDPQEIRSLLKKEKTEQAKIKDRTSSFKKPRLNVGVKNI